MPFIGAALNASASAVQLTMSAYVIGFAFGQIIYGPLSDKFGRRPVLLAGFALYLAATAACVFATSIDMLIAARITQSLGAAGPIILARAIVRDLYEGAQAGRQLALMSTIVGFTPISLCCCSCQRPIATNSKVHSHSAASSRALVTSQRTTPSALMQGCKRSAIVDCSCFSRAHLMCCKRSMGLTPSPSA
jgi:hypothetical protein